MPSISIIDRLRGERNALVDLFAEAIVIEGGRRDGSAETRVTIDLRHPELTDDEEQDGRERWRLRTARHRLARAPFSRDVLAAFHDAEAQKGRRLTAVDLRNQSRVAAMMAWHFEPRPRQGGSRRPHLVTALSVAQDAAGPLRGEYLVACWLLCMIGLAIDRRTVEKGRIGVVLDAAIALEREELAELGFRRGRKRDGYKGTYYELAA
jgi:hypothetical protein